MTSTQEHPQAHARPLRGARPVATRAAGLLVAGLALVLGASSPALAQSASRLGFRIGDKSKLHLGLNVASAFDTNPTRLADDESVSDVRLLVRPSFRVDVPGSSGELRLGVGTTLSRFLGTGGRDTGETLFGFDGNVFLRIGSRRSAVMLTVQNTPTLTPTVLPELGSIASDERQFPAFSDQGEIALTLRPGGGALEFDVGYRNQFLIFTEAGGAQPLDDSYSNVGFLAARLRFLPKTAVLLEMDFGAFDVDLVDDAQQTTFESNPYNIMVGLTGQITRTLEAEVRVGFGETLTWCPQGEQIDADGDGTAEVTCDGRFDQVDPGLNQRDIIGNVALRWKFLKTAQLSAAYTRSLNGTVLLSSVRNDTFRLTANWNIGRLVLGAYGEAQLRHFGLQTRQNPATTPDGESPTNPQATLIIGGARADYYFKDWLVGGLNWRLMDQSSNDEGRPNQRPLLGAFLRQQIFANVGVQY